MKTCSKCKIDKSFESFYFRKDNCTYRNECRTCYSEYISKQARKKVRQHIEICCNCEEIIVYNKRLSPIRKGEFTGKYACESCQNKRLRNIKTRWMSEALKDLARRDKYVEIRNNAKNAYFARNPNIKKSRSFINSVIKRIKLYNADLSRFKDIHAKQFAEVLLSLPKECKCGAVDNLTVEHIIPISIDWTLAFDKNNLTTLCRSCNTRAYSKYRYA